MQHATTVPAWPRDHRVHFPAGKRFAGRQSRDTWLARPLLDMLADLGSRDPALREHCDFVGDLAASLGRRLGLAEPTVQRLRLAGVLHDIGKVAIPERILQKPGALDDGEWKRVRRHPEAGYVLIRGVGLNEIAGWVLCHHERPDGRGYPYGLDGQRIPLEAAILSVADAYHAMTTERPYQRALSDSAACDQVLRCSGSQFDARVVDALLRTAAPAAAVAV